MPAVRERIGEFSPGECILDLLGSDLGAEDSSATGYCTENGAE
jgi:hypothetical protein